MKRLVPSGDQHRSEILFSAISWVITRGRGFSVFQMDSTRSCPAHAIIVMNCCPASPFVGPDVAALNIRGLKAVTSTGLSWPMRLISLFQVPLSIMTTVLTGPFMALAAAICDPSGDHDGRRKYVVDGELWKGCEMVFSRAKSVVRHIFTVRSSLWCVSWEPFLFYLGCEIFERRVKSNTFYMTLMRFDPFNLLYYLAAIPVSWSPKVCAFQTMIALSSPTLTRRWLSGLQLRSCTSESSTDG